MTAEFAKYTGTETILVADDEIMVRDMLSGFLSEYGYNVILAKDGQEALELYASHSDTIRLILMDIVMPRKDGLSAYTEIKDKNPRIKIILMSGYRSSNLYVPENLNIIVKPFSFHAIVKTVRNTLDGSQSI